MNKIIIIITILVTSILFAGCGEKTEEISNSKSNEIERVEKNNIEGNTSKTDEAGNIKTIESHNIDNAKVENFAEEYQLIVIDDFLMGGYKNGEWISLEYVEQHIKGNEIYKIYDFNKLLGTGTGEGVTILDPILTKMIYIDAEFELPNDYIAINGSWNIIPRQIKFQNDDSYFIELVNDILFENDINSVSATITQIYQVDLNGNGNEEILIMASNIDELGATYKKGTYSMVFINKEINGISERLFLEGDFYAIDGEYSDGGPISYEIVGIADLNNNNSMEVIVKYKYFEGFGYNIYEIKDNQANVVLSNGIGA
ncbi:UNVERIFIED_CONTAM: hypothetical protein Cloal_3570 [Acetivibrio alkalicellulosi]